MKDTNQNTRGSNSTANRCTSQRPDRPASRGGSPSIEYADLFGNPPPSPPPIDRPVSEAEKDLYEAAFRVAHERPGDLMDVLEIVRKGLQRGQKSAESGGDYRG